LDELFVGIHTEVVYFYTKTYYGMNQIWRIKGRFYGVYLQYTFVLSEAWQLLLSGSNFSVNTLETRLYMYILNCSYYEFLLIGTMCVFIHTLPYVLNMGLYW